MAPYRRLVIAAGDPRHVPAVAAHLKQSLQLDAPTVRFEDVSNLLTPETDGDLLLLGFDPADASAIETVVRETRVRQLPARLAILETQQFRSLRLLDHLDPHLAGRWTWPQQGQELTMWARFALEPGTPFPDLSGEPNSQKIRRRLINHTPSLTGMVDRISTAAAHDVPVLIEGEPGTGKSFLARLIHDCSPRRDGRFLTVACGTLSGNLLASELFGHTPGAFAGADAARVGKLAAAGGGTVLIDEIDALPPDQQAKLLRVIESGDFEPVGGHEPQRGEARVIAATNWSLADAVEGGTFRRDLYYRLHVLGFHLPPLRHRPEDIGPLARGMLARYGTKFGKGLFAICPEALRALESFPWPGNIRQLENVIQQAVLASAGGELKLHHLSPLVHAPVGPTTATAVAGAIGGTLKQSRESSERANIMRALDKAGQSRTRAAQLLGVSRVTLYKKMKKYGLFAKPGVPFPPGRSPDHSG